MVFLSAALGEYGGRVLHDLSRIAPVVVLAGGRYSPAMMKALHFAVNGEPRGHQPHQELTAELALWGAAIEHAAAAVGDRAAPIPPAPIITAAEVSAYATVIAGTAARRGTRGTGCRPR